MYWNNFNLDDFFSISIDQSCQNNFISLYIYFIILHFLLV